MLPDSINAQNCRIVVLVRYSNDTFNFPKISLICPMLNHISFFFHRIHFTSYIAPRPEQEDIKINHSLTLSGEMGLNIEFYCEAGKNSSCGEMR